MTSRAARRFPVIFTPLSAASTFAVIAFVSTARISEGGEGGAAVLFLLGLGAAPLALAGVPLILWPRPELPAWTVAATLHALPLAALFLAIVATLATA